MLNTFPKYIQIDRWLCERGRVGEGGGREGVKRRRERQRERETEREIMQSLHAPMNSRANGVLLTTPLTPKRAGRSRRKSAGSNRKT